MEPDTLPSTRISDFFSVCTIQKVVLRLFESSCGLYLWFMFPWCVFVFLLRAVGDLIGWLL